MPNRILRDWTCSEVIDSLSIEAEVFFTRLIMKVDDFGCFHGNPKLLKSALYPLRDIKDQKIIQLLQELQTSKIIHYYQVDSKKYLKINDFRQRLRKMKSNFPQPEDSCLSDDSQLSVNSQLETETEKKKKKKQNTEEMELTFPFLSDKFTTAWNGWKNYRKIEKRQVYKSKLTEQTALNGLAVKSKNNEEVAILIILQSIENTWTGLFELKNQQKQMNSEASSDHLQNLKDRLS